MERAWLFETIGITVARVDFIDPAVAHEPDARERGVRIEVRRVEARSEGSVYVSSAIAVRPAVCRIDLLESRPGAADRMHWHPSMRDGEPSKRRFDPHIPTDPLRWLFERLRDVRQLVDGGSDGWPSEHDVAAVAATSDEIVASVEAGLQWAREPWPEVTRDHRGLAVST